MLGYVLAGFAGMSLGALGGGGSVLNIPILVYCFGIPATEATTYSLFAVGTTSLIGTLIYLKDSLIRLKTGFYFFIFSFTGLTISRKVIHPWLPNPVLTRPIYLPKDKLVLIVFAVTMLSAARSMLRERREPVAETRSDNPEIAKLSVLALFAGMLMGFIGAGGGFLIVPILVLLGRVPIRLAVGTSLFIIAGCALSGFIEDLFEKPSLNWTVLFAYAGCSVVGLLVGIRLNRHLPAARLKKIFGWMILFVGASLLVRQLL